MNRATLHAGVLALCAARAIAAAAGGAPWPFSPYAMYSNPQAARIENGIPLITLDEGGPACRLPVSSFGAAGRLDLTGHLLARRGPELAASARRLCLAALAGNDRCERARFTYYLVGLPEARDRGFRVTRFSARGNDLEVSHELAGIPDVGALFPGGSCRPGA